MILPHLVMLRRFAPSAYTFQHILVIAAAGLLFTRFRDTLDGAAEALHVNGWQLRQLVPPEARAAISVAPEAEPR